MSDSLPLSDVIKELRSELSKAQSEGQGETIKFTIGAVELDLQVVVVKEGAAKVGFKIPLVDLNVDGGGKLAHTHTHTLRLKMTAHDVDAQGGDNQIKAPLEVSGVGSLPK